MENNLLEELKKFAKDEEKVLQLKEAKDLEEFRDILVSNNVKITDEEIALLYNELQKMEIKDGELSIEALSEVNGGFSGAAIAVAAGVCFLWGCYRQLGKRC